MFKNISEKLFLIFVSLGIVLELIALGWMVNNYFESKYRDKVRAELVGKGMTPEEAKEWNNKVMLDVVRAKEWENREKALKENTTPNVDIKMMKSVVDAMGNYN